MFVIKFFAGSHSLARTCAEGSARNSKARKLHQIRRDGESIFIFFVLSNVIIIYFYCGRSILYYLFIYIFIHSLVYLFICLALSVHQRFHCIWYALRKWGAGRWKALSHCCAASYHDERSSGLAVAGYIHVLPFLLIICVATVERHFLAASLFASLLFDLFRKNPIEFQMDLHQWRWRYLLLLLLVLSGIIIIIIIISFFVSCAIIIIIIIIQYYYYYYQLLLLFLFLFLLLSLLLLIIIMAYYYYYHNDFKLLLLLLSSYYYYYYYYCYYWFKILLLIKLLLSVIIKKFIISITIIITNHNNYYRSYLLVLLLQVIMWNERSPWHICRLLRGDT
jgi:hypothetical protein